MTYKKERKCHFRITEVLKSQRNRILSPLYWAALISAMLSSQGVLSRENTSAKQAIIQAVETNFKQQVQTQANSRNWGDYQLDYDLRVPDAAKHLPMCPKPLSITGIDNKTLPVGNLKRSVSCDVPSVEWRINVTIKSALTLKVVVTKAGINRDQALSPMNLKLETRTISREQDFFTQLSQVSGMVASRRIRSGQILDPRKLASTPLVAKGNQVVITASKDGFTASTKGVALEQGTRGEQIDVQNSSSGKVIKAVVTGLNQVQTQF
ncbi:flagellar basal body P-ring formation protein FlgA [Vibrio sp. Isolate23]|uniref:flagellar basal body P-ring formation chaperone FlgA n=1 Tax=Vibrio sp. Isolate23 TaxID=2908533 RepID=UPI001EFD8108|nr:flagellar basal body P-ring formation chaperone FlgA [Vibrio sp. Isolate23]MCG9684101.1 flagellar basal body P-ring formation protein FlgA [Vibrio sp. Isolate23]